jgi:hypothetical protein
VIAKSTQSIQWEKYNTAFLLRPFRGVFSINKFQMEFFAPNCKPIQLFSSSQVIGASQSNFCEQPLRKRKRLSSCIHSPAELPDGILHTKNFCYKYVFKGFAVVNFEIF